MHVARELNTEQLLASSAPRGVNPEGSVKPQRQCEEPATDQESVFIFPATPAQRRFWLLDQLQPGGNPGLNMPIALRWRGPIDPLLLQRALNEIVARHEALRTTFEIERGQLNQLIAPTLRVALAMSDAGQTPGDASAAAIRAEAQRPFDLRRGPLLRARLVRIAPSEHLLLLTIHHIISDGWSNGILTHDLCALYTGFVANSPALLSDLSIQFADFAEWQQTRLVDGGFAGQLDYWREKLSGELPGLDLPFDRPRAADREPSGKVCSRLLPPALTAAAKSYAARESASPFMVFFAVFQTLLHRYTSQVDFLITTPSANRERREFEPLMGLFVNPLLLRADLRDDPTFQELVSRVRSVTLEAFSNQDIPFELLLDEFEAPRLQVNFHYDGGLQPALQLAAGVTIEAVSAESTGSVYELSASILENPPGLRLELEYNAVLFDAETVERMLGHYETLLQSALADPLQPISRLALMTSEEERLVEQLEPTDSVDPLDLRAQLATRIMAQPDAAAARHGRRELSWAALLARLEGIEAGRQDASDLEEAAAWVAHWRARVDRPPPDVISAGPQIQAALAAASVALRELGGFAEGERIASCSLPGLAATEELGAALLANSTIVYSPAGLPADSAAALATWLDTENITVACLPAATWHKLAAAIAHRKARKPTKLRLAIVAEMEAEEGSFGRVVTDTADGSLAGVQIRRRSIMAAAGGTIALEGKLLAASGRRLRVRDLVSGQPLPIGIAGELAVADSNGVLTGTGELARGLPNDSIERLGPITAQRFARGLRIDLRLTESALRTIPGVRHALVRAGSGEPIPSLIAYVLPEVGASIPDGGELRRQLRAKRLPDAAIPASFVRLKEIPVCPETGQLDLAALSRLPRPSADSSLEPVRPYLGLQLQLIAIWEEVLGIRGIGIRDDFFDLGGNSLLAMRMLQRAETACGKVILPTALFRHPTIEQLAGEIAREARDASPALLRVHDAGTRTPFFYLHGDLTGGGFYSLKLSRALGLDQPFYVLPPQDIRMLSAAPSIEEMATAHLTALRAVRPHGPYVIGGFCIGGLVAYELAQQIKAAGEEVEMLLIIDAAPDRTLSTLRSIADVCGRLFRWDGEAKVAHFGRWAVWRARWALRFGPGGNRAKRMSSRSLGRRAGAAARFMQRRFRSVGPAQPIAEMKNVAAAERDLPSAFQWASASYRPRSYDAPVTLLLSEDVLGDATNVSRTWQQLAPKVLVQPLQGSHLECITAHVEALAKTIEHCLDRRIPRGDGNATEAAAWKSPPVTSLSPAEAAPSFP